MSDARDDLDGDVVECTVCGARIGRGPGGLGQIQHAKMHRREFVDQFDRRPDSYDEVRDALGTGYGAWLDDDQLTLAEALDERAREHRHDDDQRELLDVLEDGEVDR